MVSYSPLCDTVVEAIHNVPRFRVSCMKLMIFLLYNNLFIYQVLCTLIYCRRSLYSSLKYGLIQSTKPARTTHSNIRKKPSQINNNFVTYFTDWNSVANIILQLFKDKLEHNFLVLACYINTSSWWNPFGHTNPIINKWYSQKLFVEMFLEPSCGFEQWWIVARHYDDNSLPEWWLVALTYNKTKTLMHYQLNMISIEILFWFWT